MLLHKKSFFLYSVAFCAVFSTFFLGIALKAHAQLVYQNEWIDFNATYYKVKVAKDGLCRIPANTLQINNLLTKGTDYKIFFKGKEIPLYVSTNQLLGDADFIEFYGKKNDGDFDGKLFEVASWQLHQHESLFTDTSVYYLTVSPTTQNLRYSNPNNEIPTDLPEKETYFWHKNIKVTPNIHYAGEPLGNIGGISNYYSDFENGEGFVSSVIVGPASQTHKVNTASVYTDIAALKATLETRIVGQSNDYGDIPDHHIQVKIGNTTLIDSTFNGNTNYVFRNDGVDLSLLSPTETPVNVWALKDVSDIDNVSVAYTSIYYPHTYNFSGLKNFKFEILNDNDKYIEITNFNGESAPILLDLSNNLRIIPVTQGSGLTAIHKFYLPSVQGGGAKRTLYFTNTTNATVVNTLSGNFQTRVFTDFSKIENQGNYIILTHPILSQGSVNEVERYNNYRASAAGGSYNAVTVNVDELYDQFAWGNVNHPLAVRHFVNFAVDKWITKPSFLLLLGKSVEYRKLRTNPEQFGKNLVPSYGHIPSDLLLSARTVGSYKNQLSTGRVPAQTPEQVRAYLNKIIAYEAAKNNPCTREDRQWQKDAIMMAGGKNLGEAEEFLTDLEIYRKIYEDPAFAGRVVEFYTKASENVIDFPDLSARINAGLRLIGFVGHSSGQYWDISLGPPEIYNNQDKYPFIISSSCFVGNVHNATTTAPSMCEDYILAENKGAIGFLASVSFGYPAYMHIYINDLYNQFCNINYNQPIGNSISKTVGNIYQNYATSHGMRITTEEYTLSGDPALIINPFERPEYIIENNQQHADVFFEPENITTNLDSFAVKINVTNLGKAVSDSFTVKITRKLNNDSTQIISKKFASVVYQDTLTMYVRTGSSNVAQGDNVFTVSIDADNNIPEDCENNNTVTLTKFIFSDLLVPISPCNFSIINSFPVTLYASTGQSTAPVIPYIIQIDTSELFNSPAFRQKAFNSAAGVVSWQPDMVWSDSTVYYWRTSQVPNDGVSYNWQYSSFTYLPKQSAGWNQQHYYQYKKDKFESIKIDSISRRFNFKKTQNYLLATNSYNYYPKIGYSLNYIGLASDAFLKGTCAGGLAIAAFKPSTILEPMVAIKDLNTGNSCDGRSTVGSIQSGDADRYRFEFTTSTPEQIETMLNFVNNIIPDGYYVLVYSIRDHRLSTTDATQPVYAYLPQIEGMLQTLGIDSIVNTIPNTNAFIAVGRKGEHGFTALKKTDADPNANFNLELYINGESGQANITSTIIGPSHKWQQLYSHFGELNPNEDNVNIKIWGYNNGTETLLQTVSPQQTIDITNIDAQKYPFLRLQATLLDTLAFTAPQLHQWRVNYNMATEIALNPTQHLVFYNDTIEEGENIRLEMGIKNVTPVPSDSLWVKYTIIKENGVAVPIPYPKQAPVPAWGNIITYFSHNSQGLEGNNVLQVELNGNQEQLEKFKFNNLISFPFFVKKDKINPVVDVTFDGAHIVNHDLVSAKPQIQISLQDENRFLALNDTADYTITIKQPDSTYLPVHFNSAWVQFAPATDPATKNKAQITLNPIFDQSGTYTLTLKAKDRSNNNFAPIQHSIAFKVETKPMISNVLNYPNPFSTHTQFVFTLTGSQVPDRLQITIMTISGKVVRQIELPEMGNVRVGTNITNYAWDGTDQFGNFLANGVYLYKVNAFINGKKIDLYENASTDNYFENGIGKMYLMR